MSFTDYEQCFVSLSSFLADLYFPNSTMAKMFEDRLSPHIQGIVSVQRLRKLRDVIAAALIVERNKFEIQRSREAQGQLGAQIEKKIRGNRSLVIRVAVKGSRGPRDIGQVLRGLAGRVYICQFRLSLRVRDSDLLIHMHVSITVSWVTLGRLPSKIPVQLQPQLRGRGSKFRVVEGVTVSYYGTISGNRGSQQPQLRDSSCSKTLTKVSSGFSPTATSRACAYHPSSRARISD